MKKYYVDKMWFDKNYQTFISYEAMIEFDNLEEAIEYKNRMILSEFESCIILEKDQYDNYDLVDY